MGGNNVEFGARRHHDFIMEIQVCKNVIAEMGNKFDSHDFILVLLKRYAAVYCATKH